MKTVNSKFMARRQFMAVIFLLFAFAYHACTPSTAAEQTQAPNPIITASTFELPDYQGTVYNTQQFKGKYIVIHIATTWCPFCNAEAPNLEKLYQAYRDKGVEVLIIDVKEDKELVKEKLIDRFNLSFPVLFDTDGTVAASFAPPDVLPDLARDEVMLASNLLIDPEGNIRFFSLLDTQDFDAKLIELNQLLDELL